MKAQEREKLIELLWKLKYLEVSVSDVVDYVETLSRDKTSHKEQVQTVHPQDL